VVSSSIDFKIMLKFNIHSECFEDLQSIVSHLRDRGQKTEWRGFWNGKNWSSAYVECTKNQQKYLAILHKSVKWEEIPEGCPITATKKHTYYLISTINSQIEGWEIIEKGTKKECQKALQNLPSNGDIFVQTFFKNAKIVCKTKAKKLINIEFL